jgi:hypothetical protein
MRKPKKPLDILSEEPKVKITRREDKSLREEISRELER